MEGNRSKHTRPEILLRSELWGRGVRYRLHAADLPGKPDLVFRGRRVAVFVDGDFWHGRDWSVRRARLEKGSNADYWLRKIEYNRARSNRQTEELEADGWTVIRMWESEVKDDPEGCADRIQEALLVARR